MDLKQELTRQLHTQKKGATNKLADSVSKYSMNDRESQDVISKPSSRPSLNQQRVKRTAPELTSRDDADGHSIMSSR